MSLDVYLTIHGVTRIVGEQIFVREDGETKAISREEWDSRNPGREPVTVAERETESVYSANITHNLGRMASEANIYAALWHPEELRITKASQLIHLLEAGLELLKSDPQRFNAFNPENGWGTYDGLVRFVEDYLHACRDYPEAEVSVSR